MKEKKMLLVVNPVSGKAKAEKCLLKIIRIFAAANYSVTVYPTVSKGQTIKYIKRNAEKYNAIVSCGGDGTFSETVAGLMQCIVCPPFGYIPLGTTNDIAATHCFPLNPLDAARAITAGKAVGFDVGMFNGKYFSYIAASGAFTEVSFKTPIDLKQRLGHLAYVIEGMKSFLAIKPMRLKVEFDGKAVDGKYIYVSVSNSTSVGGIVKLDDGKVNTNDGEFELLLIKAPSNPAEATEIVLDVLHQKFNSNMVKLYHVFDVKVTSIKPISWTLDGEDGGMHSRAHIKNCNGAINLIKKQSET